ncbi:teratocarcinoma-derived growth factor 1 [Heterocephalus glaber]|uniref:Teratocarcinoma-derived growth factor 1 n=1 Tax=Heterocephalus glaber TaxID=10181 RepID=A0AAX6SYB7_HETGA|nr:teratocarcinoma-derived growth factor 1 [Heterocephalus glaber]
MKHFSSVIVILIVAVSHALDLGLVAGSGRREPARLSPGGLAFGSDRIRPQGEPPMRPGSSEFVPPVGIQDSKELNKTCCLNGGTCILGSFCACPPSFYGRNCERNTYTQKCGSLPHGSWLLPRKCSMCRCWLGQIRCFPQTFLPGCDAHMRDQHLVASGTRESAPLAGPAVLLPGICLFLQTRV